MDPDGHAPRVGLDAINAMAVLVPGTWHAATAMIREADDTWRLEFTPPHPGLYLIAFQTAPNGPWNEGRFSIRAVSSPAPGGAKDRGNHG
jgi:hypothetical protein